MALWWRIAVLTACCHVIIVYSAPAQSALMKAKALPKYVLDNVGGSYMSSWTAQSPFGPIGTLMRPVLIFLGLGTAVALFPRIMSGLMGGGFGGGGMPGGPGRRKRSIRHEWTTLPEGKKMEILKDIHEGAKKYETKSI